MNENRPFRCGEDMASTWLQDGLEIADPFFKNRGVFRCRPSGGLRVHKDIPIQHVMGSPANEKTLLALEANLRRELTPSQWAVLARWNGCTLFTQLNGLRGQSGIRLYSAEELQARHTEAQMILDELLTVMISHTDGETAGQARHMLDYWLPRQLVIGEVLGSGNYLSLDGTILSGRESHVVLLDAELLNVDIFEMRVLAPSLTDMLLLMMESPVRFLESVGGVRYQVGHRVWVPETFRLA